MGLFSFMSRRRKGDGTTLESPIAVEDNEAAIAWLHRNYMKRGFIPSGGGDVPAAAGYSGIQITLQNPKGETVKVYFKFGDVDLNFGTTIESPIVVESIAAEYEWIRDNRPGFMVVAQALIVEKGFYGDQLTLQSSEGETLTLYFQITGDMEGEYVGEYKDDMRHGQGTFTWSDGRKYVGEWRDGKRHGKGAYTCDSGYRYVGGFKNNKEHGEGISTYPDGEKYVGEFQDGEKHGRGTHTLPNGNKYFGEWKSNERWNGTERDSSGNAIAIYAEGVPKSSADSTSVDKGNELLQRLNFSKVELQELIDKFGSPPRTFQSQQHAMKELWHHFGDNKEKLLGGYAWLEIQGSVKRKSISEIDVLHYAEALYNHGKEKGWLGS